MNHRTTYLPLLIAAAAVLLCLPSAEAVRLKDVTQVEGSRDNQLVGYGLVVGLAGTGDSSLTYTIQSIANSLQRFGVEVPVNSVQAENVAAVMVTADIGPFARPGSRMDVTVSSLGDAETIQGGILLQTPLMGADEAVYAVAQGPVAVGGFLGGAGGEGGATVQQNHPTVGIISGGGIVERPIMTELVQAGAMNLLLNNPDATSAVRIAESINNEFPGIALAQDYGTVNVQLPVQFIGQEMNFLAAIGRLRVTPDIPARIIINERTGTIVATADVRISTVAVSHGSLTIQIARNENVSQPNPLSETGETVTSPTTTTEVTEGIGGFHVVEDYPSIQRLTAALNALGVSTREMIAILQTMKRAGALQAELIIN